ncbi:hypothetical protein F4803DRAFT_551207 [Xylaria telfairii]|nr:hypothetical protein F4803DRAFT_551207 [Xylaria telfairii]
MLCDAGTHINGGDKCGRKPIHFAASTPFSDCIALILGRVEDSDMINVADDDGWTPPLWAARSGSDKAVTQLVTHGADVWARGGGVGGVYGAKREWSALKLINFADRSMQLSTIVEPHERRRLHEDGVMEEWDPEFHKADA